MIGRNVIQAAADCSNGSAAEVLVSFFGVKGALFAIHAHDDNPVKHV